ncbi:hypothetical protein BC829DRAFT_448884 [Chytridium lagenaria]|nr:hypothetical protein BC829DRAFT_448884 [Chytridium lagenaria]
MVDPSAVEVENSHASILKVLKACMDCLQRRVLVLDANCRHFPSSFAIATSATLVYAVIAKVTQLTIIKDYASFWPANGFVVGTLLQLNLLQTLIFIPLAMATNFSIGISRFTVVISTIFLLLNTAECTIIYAMIRRFAPMFKELSNPRTAIVIVLSAVTGSAVAGLLGGVLMVVSFNNSDFSKYSFEAFKRFMMVCLGHLAIIPFMLSLGEWRNFRLRGKKDTSKAIMAIGCLLVILLLELTAPLLPKDGIFLSAPSTLPYLTHMIAFPLVLLCGMLMGTVGFTTSTLVLAMSGVFGIVFTSRENDVIIGVLLLRFQLLIMVVMISSLSLMVIDRSRQKALTEAIRATNQKSAFMAFLCHELRNPLHAILNVNIFLKETPLTQEQRQMCEAMSIAGTYMSQIISDVLDTSRFEVGNISLLREPVDVVSIVRDVALQTREDLKIRGVEFGLHVKMAQFWEGSLFMVDQMRLKQLLNNLLAHAIKVTPEGASIDCEVWCKTARSSSWPTMTGRPSATSFRCRSKDDCTFCIQVTDSGPGIPPDIAGIIFKPFEMGCLETAQEYSGTGLGLAICKQIVDLMKGTIEVRPKDGGVGSTFLVTIPLVMCTPGASEGGDVPDGCENSNPGESSSVARNDDINAEFGNTINQNDIEMGIYPKSSPQLIRCSMHHPIEKAFLKNARESSTLFGFRSPSLKPPNNREPILATPSSQNKSSSSEPQARCADLSEEPPPTQGRHVVVKIKRPSLCTQPVCCSKDKPLPGGELNYCRVSVEICPSADRNCHLNGALLSDDASMPSLRPLTNTMRGRAVSLHSTTSALNGAASNLLMPEAMTLSAEKSDYGGNITGLVCRNRSPSLSSLQRVSGNATLPLSNPNTSGFGDTIVMTPDNRSILIADDSSINRKILFRLLRRAGVTRNIEECTNGQEAVDRVAAKPRGYTGIFMDLQMPVMDGTEATRRIRAIEGDQDEENAVMPIVAVTASFVEEDTLKREFGFTALAPKPFLKADAERILMEYGMK